MKYQEDNRKYQEDNRCETSKTVFLYSTSFKNICTAISVWKMHLALLKQSISTFWKLRGPRKTYSGAPKRPTKRFKRASKRFKALLNTHNTSPLFAWAWFCFKTHFSMMYLAKTLFLQCQEKQTIVSIHLFLATKLINSAFEYFWQRSIWNHC